MRVEYATFSIFIINVMIIFTLIIIIKINRIESLHIIAKHNESICILFISPNLNNIIEVIVTFNKLIDESR